jgi:tRNA(Ile)-lysidine synthase TilS/MesJ
MKCVKCNGKATVHSDNLDACSGCFQKIIQKRVRKEIRINKLIEKNDKILIINDGTAEAKLMPHLLKEILKDLPVIISDKKSKYALGEEIKGKYNKIIIPWNADREGEYLLNYFFAGKKPKYLSHFKLKGKTYIKPFIHVLHKEVEEFSKIRKIKFKETKTNSMASEMIDKLQKEYPEITFSLVKSSEELKKII